MHLSKDYTNKWGEMECMAAAILFLVLNIGKLAETSIVYDLVFPPKLGLN